MHCELQGRCSGCSWLGIPYSEQLERKRTEILKLFSEAQVELPDDSQTLKIVSAGESALRDRVDLTLQTRDGKTEIGLFEIGKRDVIDIKSCPQMTPALEAWFKDFRQNLPKVKVGSVRLRVSPQGERGLWIDFSNVDIKACLDERTWLEGFLKSGVIVEMGQRRKRVELRPEGLKLTDPSLHPWFETYVGNDLNPAALYCSVGSFTQAGFQANKALVREIGQTIENLPGGHWLELFSGMGNFTLPLASWKSNVQAFDLDHLAVDGLQRSLNDLGWSGRVQASQRDLYRKTGLPDFSKCDGLLVDPPRSGLKGVVEALEHTSPNHRPVTILYVSCFGPTLAEDCKRLKVLGYKVTSLKGVDQFAQSPHCEWIASLSLEPAG